MVQSGTSPTEVARQLKVGTTSIFNWLAKYRKGGWGALRTGARSGRPRKLDGTRLKFVFDLVTIRVSLRPECLILSGMSAFACPA